MRVKIRRKKSGAGFRWYVSSIDAAGNETARGGYRTRADAKAAAATLVTDADRGRSVAPSKVTLAEYLKDWLVRREASGTIAPSTLESDAWAIRSWISPRIGDIPLQRLSASDLEHLYAELRTHGGREGRALSDKTVRNVHLILSKALGDAVRLGKVPVSAASLAEAPKGHRTERAAWTASEARTFLHAAEFDRLGAIWRLMLATGLRRGEVLGATWDDIDLQDRSIQVRRQVLIRGRSSTLVPGLYVRSTLKGRRPRTIRFDEATGAALEKWRKKQLVDRFRFGPAWRANGGLGIEANWVVTEPNGLVVHPDTLRNRFVRLAKAAGVEPLVLHGTRHSFATIALAEGVRPDLVSQALGHATVGFTLDVYAHPDAEEHLAAADMIGAAFEEKRTSPK
jgi:integrase